MTTHAPDDRTAPDSRSSGASPSADANGGERAFVPDDELIGAYFDGELRDEKLIARAEHLLAEQPESRALWDELRSLRQSFEQAPRHKLRSDFRDRVLAQAEQQVVSGQLEPARSPLTAHATSVIAPVPIDAEQVHATHARTWFERGRRPLAYALLATAAAIGVAAYDWMLNARNDDENNDAIKLSRAEPNAIEAPADFRKAAKRAEGVAANVPSQPTGAAKDATTLAVPANMAGKASSNQSEQLEFDASDKVGLPIEPKGGGGAGGAAYDSLTVAGRTARAATNAKGPAGFGGGETGPTETTSESEKSKSSADVGQTTDFAPTAPPTSESPPALGDTDLAVDLQVHVNAVDNSDAAMALDSFLFRQTATFGRVMLLDGSQLSDLEGTKASNGTAHFYTPTLDPQDDYDGSRVAKEVAPEDVAITQRQVAAPLGQSKVVLIEPSAHNGQSDFVEQGIVFEGARSQVKNALWALSRQSAVSSMEVLPAANIANDADWSAFRVKAPATESESLNAGNLADVAGRTDDPASLNDHVPSLAKVKGDAGIDASRKVDGNSSTSAPAALEGVEPSTWDEAGPGAIVEGESAKGGDKPDAKNSSGEDQRQHTLNEESSLDGEASPSSSPDSTDDRPKSLPKGGKSSDEPIIVNGGASEKEEKSTGAMPRDIDGESTDGNESDGIQPAGSAGGSADSQSSKPSTPVIKSEGGNGRDGGERRRVALRKAPQSGADDIKDFATPDESKAREQVGASEGSEPLLGEAPADQKESLDQTPPMEAASDRRGLLGRVLDMWFNANPEGSSTTPNQVSAGEPTYRLLIIVRYARTPASAEIAAKKQESMSIETREDAEEHLESSEEDPPPVPSAKP